jgi:hypothetical protein
MRWCGVVFTTFFWCAAVQYVRLLILYQVTVSASVFSFIHHIISRALRRFGYVISDFEPGALLSVELRPVSSEPRSITLNKIPWHFWNLRSKIRSSHNIFSKLDCYSG